MKGTLHFLLFAAVILFVDFCGGLISIMSVHGPTAPKETLAAAIQKFPHVVNAVSPALVAAVEKMPRLSSAANRVPRPAMEKIPHATNTASYVKPHHPPYPVPVWRPLIATAHPTPIPHAPPLKFDANMSGPQPWPPP